MGSGTIYKNNYHELSMRDSADNDDGHIEEAGLRKLQIHNVKSKKSTTENYMMTR